jgi:hypothetical protein
MHHTSASVRSPGGRAWGAVGKAAETACAAALAVALTACASGGGRAPPSSGDRASDTEWLALATPRPEPLDGAVRLSFTGVELPEAAPWSLASRVPPDLGLSELVIAGLLRRRDVELVERRRFAAAVEAEHAGSPRAPGAPPAGVSPGAQMTATVVWLPLGERVSLEIRLSRPQTGAVVAARRRAIPAGSDPVAAARAIVATILATLDGLGELPTWDDPVAGATPATDAPSGIPLAAVERFLDGLAAEERWNWEAARRSYEVAAASTGFIEAEAALARTARLRIGGTLGES